MLNSLDFCGLKYKFICTELEPKHLSSTKKK